MTTKQQIIDTHIAHPEWSCREIGDALKCHDRHVYATFVRNGLDPPISLARITSTPEQLRAKAAALIRRAEAIERREALRDAQHTIDRADVDG